MNFEIISMINIRRKKKNFIFKHKDLSLFV